LNFVLCHTEQHDLNTCRFVGSMF